ncbi:LAGLIDADG family homing endonuclease [Clostridium amazonitimonense]|uniref:LAGLIDADG family homing endonuclease n=1 Tax=Clostridium amazonitimonense TaxID=1499689 RepID=UPI00068E999E|nr:LAGLIDADG family homing endonuclease [Clostridium amazonitimonense]
MSLCSKIPYNKLNDELKDNIVDCYYKRKDLNFVELSSYLNVSERALSRVLKEFNINTKRLNRYRLNERYFQRIDSQEKAYLLGLIYADGFVGDHNCNNIVIGLKDRDMIVKIAKLLEYDGKIRIGNKGSFENSGYSYILNFSSKEMAMDLRKLGLYPNKSLTMTDLPSINEELYRHFIRGYFDGDGSIILTKKCSYYRTESLVKKYEYPCYMFCLLGTREFLQQISYKLKSSYIRINDTKTEEIKALKISAKCEFYKLFQYLYKDSTIYLDRKYEKWLQILSAFTK